MLQIKASLVHKLVEAEDDSTRICNRLQCLLGCAVQSEAREQHIAVIMTLPQPNQQCLALEIDAILSRLSHVKAADDESAAASEEVSVTGEKSGGTPLKAIGNELGPALKRSLRTNAALKQENESLHAENKELQDQLDELKKQEAQQQGGNVRQSVQQSMEDLKADFKERELDLLNTLKEKEGNISDLKIRIDSLLKEVTQAKKLKDEIEILRAQANDAVKANQALAKLRQKLDVATGYKKQLDVMQAKFEELLQKNLEAEKQVKLIPNLKRDLESCKATLMQSELKYSELQLLNDEKEQMLKKMQEEWAAVRESEMQATLENVALQKNLEAADVAEDPANVLGDGCTELNPHIREEMERLQEENKALRAATSDQGADNLRELALSLENMTRLKEGLQDKLLCSKKEIEKLQSKLQASEKDVSRLEAAKLEADEEIKQQLGKIGVISGKFASSEQELESCLTDVDSLKGELTEAAARMRELEDKSAAETNKLDQLLQESLASNQALRLERERDLVQFNTNLREVALQSFVAETCSSIVQSAVLNCHEKEFDEYKQMHSMSSVQFSKLQEQWEVQKQRLEQSLQQEKKDHSEVKRVLEQKLAQVGAQELEMEELSATMVRVGEAISTKLNVLEVEVEASSTFDDKVMALVNIVETYATTLQEQTGTIERSSKDLKDFESKVSSMRELLQTNKGELESKQGLIGELTAKCTILEEAESRAKELNRDLKDRLRKAEEQTEQQHAQLLQLRRQFKALQIQRKQGSRIAEGTNGDMGVLTAEMNRLKQELKSMAAKNQTLSNRLLTSESGTLKCIEGDNRGLAEMVRSYEAQLAAQEEEKQTMSLARASEVTMRLELTNKLARAETENEELKGQIVSLQLQVERVRNKMANLQASCRDMPMADDKENASKAVNQRLATPSKRKSALAKTPAKPLPFSPAPIGPSPAALEVTKASTVDTPSKCNQQ